MNHPLVPTPSLRASGATAGVCAGLAVALGAFLPEAGVALIFVVLGCVVAHGWPRLVNLPSPRGTSAVLAGTTLVLATVMLTASSGQRTRWAGVVLCLGLVASFLHQLLRADGRPRLVMSLAGTALGLGFLGAGAYLLAAHDTTSSRHLLVATGAAIAVGSAADGVAGASSRRLLFGALQVVLGALAGCVAVLTGAHLLPAALVGAASGLLGWAALRTTVTNATSAHTRAQLAAGSAAALLCGFVPFVGGRRPG